MGKAEWDRPGRADVLGLCMVVPPMMWGDSRAKIKGGKISNRRSTTPARLKPEERLGLVLGTQPKRLIVFPSGWRASRPGKRAWTGGPHPSAVSQKCGYLTSRTYHFLSVAPAPPSLVMAPPGSLPGHSGSWCFFHLALLSLVVPGVVLPVSWLPAPLGAPGPSLGTSHFCPQAWWGRRAVDEDFPSPSGPGAAWLLGGGIRRGGVLPPSGPGWPVGPKWGGGQKEGLI